MNGTFFELAYHDYTQPRAFCGCERSVKTVDPASGAIADAFSLRCPPKDQGRDYVVPLSFELTTSPGLLNGSCRFLEPFGTETCPDYVVDVGTRDAAAPYPWVIEFQCVESRWRNATIFVGINFYSRVVSEDALDAMTRSAAAHGLAEYVDAGWPSGLHLVNHSGCVYPPL